MGISETLKNNPAITTIVAIVLLGAAVAVALRKPADPAGERSYFFDLKTGEIFAAERREPPITSPAGNMAVKANIYSCAACNEATWFIASLETREGSDPLNVKPRIAAPPASGAEPVWLDPTSAPAQQIVQTAINKCGSTRTAVYCRP